MALIPTTLNLDQFQTNNILKLESRGVGVYENKMNIRGNSLLSSVFVKSISPGAVLQVNYYDTTTGSEDTPERFDLNSHDPVTDADAGKTFRITVPRIHNKPIIEAIVTGGTVEFGVYITVVSSFVSDLDSALVRDQTPFEPLINKGMPMVCYDEANGVLGFVRCDDGKLQVDGTFEEAGVLVPANSSVGFGVANVEQSFVFPANTQKFAVVNESNNAVVKASWASGQSGTNFWRIYPGQTYTSPTKAIGAASVTIYWQSNKVITAADGLKVISWA